MQKGVILGCGNKSNVGIDTVTLLQERFLSSWQLERLSFAFVSWSVTLLGLRL
jgi:hypothetical protein